MTTGPGSDALRSLVQRLPDRVPIERIERLWIFPPRPVGTGESGLLVLSMLPADPDDPTRRVLTLRYRTERGKRGVECSDTLAEQGSAPADRVDRVIEGVVRRLGDESGEPSTHEIRGEPQRWAEFLDSLGASDREPPREATAHGEPSAPAIGTEPDPAGPQVDRPSGE